MNSNFQEQNGGRSQRSGLGCGFNDIHNQYPIRCGFNDIHEIPFSPLQFTACAALQNS